MNKSIKKIAIIVFSIIILYSITFLLLYVLFSFVLLNTDVASWSQETRFDIVALSLSLLFFEIIMIESNKLK